MQSKSSSFFMTALVAVAASMSISAASAATIDGTTSMQVTGNVQSVDVTTRAVTVINSQGATEVFRVGSNVPNLDKLQMGTKVTGSIQRPVRLIVLDNGAPTPTQAQAGNRIIASVTGVDSQRGQVTIRDTQGAEMLVQASAPSSVSSVRTGARVLVEISIPGASK
jgi:Cu/Ag efflux protein CusF